jgi:hypothetical protein
MTKREEMDALCAIVAPWLPGATIADTFDFELQDECGCYSEYTQEPCGYSVLFTAPWDKSDDELARLITVIEPTIEAFAMRQHTFSGCGCCDEDGSGRPNFYIRVSPVRA